MEQGNQRVNRRVAFFFPARVMRRSTLSPSGRGARFRCCVNVRQRNGSQNLDRDYDFSFPRVVREFRAR